MATGVRTTELCNLDLDQFKHEKVLGKDAVVFYPKVQSTLGESKNKKGGVQAVRYRSNCVPVRNISFFGGTLNVYRLIMRYIVARRIAKITVPRFFVGAKGGARGDLSEFFHNQPLGKNTCSGTVRSICTKLGILGSGEAAYMTTHGLRATMISLLISAGYSDCAVALRSGHRDLASLQSYHNLRGKNGENQLAAVFGGIDIAKEGEDKVARAECAKSEVQAGGKCKWRGNRFR